MMKSKRFFPLLLAMIFVAASLGALRAEDWKTIDGKTYQDVQVVQAEPDAVTILHKDGGALVPLEMLPPDLQQRFHFDPVQAKAAADLRQRRDFADARALRAERAEATRMREEGDAAASTTEAATSAGDETRVGSSALSSIAGTHYSMDDLVNSAKSMRRDLSDPSYSTMAHLAVSARSLGPDRADPNHHSISEIADSGL